jgi:LysM repeat protein
VDQILAANPQIKNPDKIKDGQKITIPVPAVEDLPGSGEESAAP